MTITFKINGIKLSSFFSLIDELNFRNRFFVVYSKYNERRFLWLVLGIKYIIQYYFAKGQQPITKIEDLFKTKLEYFFGNRNKFQENEKVVEHIRSFLQKDEFIHIKDFLTSNDDIDVNNIVKKYPIFNEQQKVINELEKRNIEKINSLKELQRLFNSPHLTPTTQNRIKSFINCKGFLLFYKENDKEELKEFFKWSEILTLLSDTERRTILETLSNCVLLFSDKEIDEIKQAILRNYPLDTKNYWEQIIEPKIKENTEQNFIWFLKYFEKIDEEKIKKIFSGIKGYSNLHPNKFFNVKLHIENNLIKNEDFERLLYIVNLTFDEIRKDVNEFIKERSISEIDFWCGDNKISLYFKFIYLSLNIYFNFLFDTLTTKHD